MPVVDIPTKEGWRQKRVELGIPSKLTKKVSMGNEFQAYWNIKDRDWGRVNSNSMKRVASALKTLESKVKKYKDKVSEKPDDTFEGEKNAILNYFENILEAIEDEWVVVGSVHKARKAFVSLVKSTRRKLNTLDVNNIDDVVTFFNGSSRQIGGQLNRIDENKLGDAFKARKNACMELLETAQDRGEDLDGGNQDAIAPFIAAVEEALEHIEAQLLDI